MFCSGGEAGSETGALQSYQGEGFRVDTISSGHMALKLGPSVGFVVSCHGSLAASDGRAIEGAFLQLEQGPSTGTFTFPSDSDTDVPSRLDVSMVRFGGWCVV